MLRCTYDGVPTPIPLWYKITGEGDDVVRTDISTSNPNLI